MSLYDQLDTELQEPLRKMPVLNIDSPGKKLIAKLFGGKKAKAVAGISVHNERVGANQVRVFEPATPGSGALVWIHGGGLILGSIDQDDLLLSELARDLNIRVFSIGYRLAPRHPYPSALDDCQVGYLWVMANASRFGINPEKVVLAGASAGGCLAAALSLKLRDENRSPKATALLYPMLDDRTGANKALDGTSLVWTNQSNRWAWSQYLGYQAGSKEPVGYSVPGRVENLSGLAPTWIGVGDVDLFYKEDLEFASRLQLAGVTTTVRVYPGYPHAAEVIVPQAEISKQFKRDLTQFIELSLASS